MGKRGPKPSIPPIVIVYARDVGGLTFQKIADTYGLTRQRVHQIYQHHKEKGKK